MEHFENNKIIYDWQYGFRSKRSAETQLVTLIHELGKTLDNRKQTDITVWTSAEHLTRCPINYSPYS